MPRLPKSTWDSIKNLYISGVSLGEIHRRTGIKRGTLHTRAAREKWTQARQDTETLKAQVVPYDPDAEMVRITSENARETRRYMSEYLMKAARQLAEGGSFPVPHTVEEAAVLERIRSSLWPQPIEIDRRSVSVNIAQQRAFPGGTQKTRGNAETDVKERPAYVAPDFEGKCKIFPERDVILLPYQERWVKDNSRLKLAVKARQIGFSWCTAYRTVRTLAADDARLDSWISSRDEISARLFLEDCKKFADVLSVAATDLGLEIIDQSGNTAFTLRFANGTRAFSLSSNADAQAGKRGSRILDEFALHPDPRKLYQIAYPGTTWGGTLEIFSTHRASRNFFNELAREITERNNPKGFSFHKITLEDALKEGLLYKLQSKLPGDDPRVQMDESDYHNFMRSGCADEESFLQEFCCVPADDNTAFLSYDIITACEYQSSEEWQSDLLDCKNPLFIGVDIGREHDLTVIWLVESVNGVHFTRRIIEMEKQTFDAQEHALYELLKLRMVRRCCIDRSGLGRQFAERAQKKFGAYRVEGIDFTQGSKEELAYPVRLAFEDRAVRVPFSNAIRADLRGVRKLITSSGNTRFAGERNQYGHCDRFWALALALHAAKQPVTGAIMSIEGIRIDRRNVAPRRSFTPRTLGQGVFQGYFET